MNIKYYSKCRNIERLSGKFKHRNYNLMEHQWMVGMLFKHFASLEDVSYDIQVWDIVLNHDIVESCTQDLSYDVKNFNEKTKESWESIENELLKKHFQLERYSDKNIKEGLTPLQFKLFKICDLLDLWIFCKEEEAIGNKSIDIHYVTEKCEELILGKFNFVDKFIEEYEY